MKSETVFVDSHWDLRQDRPDVQVTRIPCCPPRTYAVPAPDSAHAPDVVFVPERATRTALVLGIKVEIPLQGPPKRTFR